MVQMIFVFLIFFSILALPSAKASRREQSIFSHIYFNTCTRICQGWFYFGAEERAFMQGWVRFLQKVAGVFRKYRQNTAAKCGWQSCKNVKKSAVRQGEFRHKGILWVYRGTNTVNQNTITNRFFGRKEVRADTKKTSQYQKHGNGRKFRQCQGKSSLPLDKTGKMWYYCWADNSRVAKRTRVGVEKLNRLWAEMHQQEYLALGEDTRTCRLQASLTRLRGVCEADSWNEFHEPLRNRPAYIWCVTLHHIYAGISKRSQRGGLENFLRVSM